MDIEQIMLDVQTEFESSGLTDGLCGDFTREVVKRAIYIEREECASICDKQAKDSECPECAIYCADAIRERV